MDYIFTFRSLSIIYLRDKCFAMNVCIFVFFLFFSNFIFPKTLFFIQFFFLMFSETNKF